MTTPLDAFRLELGDRDATAPLFNDTEAQYFIDKQPGNVLLAVADACESLARRYSRDVDVETDGQKLLRSQKAKAYLEQAKQLRKRAQVGAPWHGGGSQSRKDGLAADTDRVQPRTSRGQFDSPSSITPPSFP